MHYKNGREAKIGDKVLVIPQYGNPRTGVLLSATPGSTTCNGQIVPLNATMEHVTLSECIHLDDVQAKELNVVTVAGDVDALGGKPAN